MTREEAIQILKDISWQMGSVKRWENIETIDMAIEALQREEAEAKGWCRRINAEPMQHHLGKSADICVIDEPNEAVDKNDEVIDHDRDWIIGCLEHDGFIHTHRFDKANRIILEALQTDGVSREQYQRVIDTVANLTEEISSMVKVVRCKDCQHRAYDKYSDVWCCTKCGYELGEENDFCSLGERRKP